MKFSPRQFANPRDYKQHDIRDVEQTMLDSASFKYVQNKFKNFNQAKSDASITQILNQQWKLQDDYYQGLLEAGNLKPENFAFNKVDSVNPIPVWRYFATTSGAIRTYPAVTLPSDYDPIQRDWFKLAITNPDKLFFTPPYLDTLGMGYVVTIAKAIKVEDSTDEVYGVLATDYFAGQVGNLFLNKIELCRAYPKNCLIVDSTGAIIFWNEFNTFKNEIINLSPLFIDQLRYRKDVSGSLVEDRVTDILKPTVTSESRLVKIQLHKK